MICENCGVDHEVADRIDEAINNLLDNLVSNPANPAETVHAGLQAFLDKMVEDGELEVGEVVEVVSIEWPDEDGETHEHFNVGLNLGWTGEFVNFEDWEECDG